MKVKSRAILPLYFCFATIAFGQEAGDLRIAAADTVLDSSPLADRPDANPSADRPDDTTAPPASATPETIAPVLELNGNVDGGADLRVKRVERKWRVIPFGRLKVTYDDNLFISPTNPESDVFFTLSPGIAAGWGDYAKEVRQLGEFEHYFEVPEIEVEDVPHSFGFVKYLASETIFSDHSGEDALDHDALLSGRVEFAKLQLNGRLYFKTLSGTDVELGDRVKRKVYGGSVGALYNFSDKTSFEISLSNDSYDYENRVDWREWVLEDYLNYQVLPKTRVAIGTRFGLVDVKTGDTQTYEALVARVIYSSSSKLALSLDGGLESRQYGSGTNDDLLSVFNLAATYEPFDGTSISGSAYRRTTTSVAEINQNITATGVAVRIRQRFLHRFYFTMEAGYDRSEYDSVVNASDAGRSDDRTYIKPSASFDVTKYLSAESSFQYQRNDSSVSDFTFTENIFSVQLNLQF